MRKFATALASVLLIVGLSACDTGEVNSSGPTASTVAPSATPSPSLSEEPTEAPETTEELFLETLHEEIPETAGAPDALALDLANTICEAFDTGASFEDVAFEILNSDPLWNDYNTGYFIGLSVGAFCPEHSDVIADAAGV